MREKHLIVVGCQEEKLNQIDKKTKERILDYINGNGHEYKSVISVIRRPMTGDANFRASQNTMSHEDVYLDYESDLTIEVPGYNVDTKLFRRDCEYDIIGISTAASVLCIAMSLYSAGMKINVLSKYCADRKGKYLEEYAYGIIQAYMPNCLK